MKGDSAMERKIDLLANDGKYYLLNYTHKELEDLLHKVALGCLLNPVDYNVLMELGVNNLSTFSGDYDDLEGKPDFDSLEQTVDDLCNCTGGSLLQKRIDNIQEDIAAIQVNIIEEIRKVMDRQQEIQGDFVDKQEILMLQASIDDLSDVLDLLRKEIEEVRSISRNKASLSHTHNAAEFKLGGLTLDAAMALKAGRDHIHSDLELKVDEIDDNCVALETEFKAFKMDANDLYQTQTDLALLTESKDIVGAINELYRLFTGK
jgi:hypothetical protein